jgi:hypothetical protein
MAKDQNSDPVSLVAANDNGNDRAEAGVRIEAAALRLARLIGRQMARDDFALRCGAANDNEPVEDVGGG